MISDFTDSKPTAVALLAVITISLVAPVVAQDNHTAGNDEHQEHVPFHIPAEIISILAGILSIGAAVATANKYGGDIGQALYVVGAGIGIYSLHLLWHALPEVGVLAAGPTNVGTVYMYLVASVLTASGFVMAYRAM